MVVNHHIMKMTAILTHYVRFLTSSSGSTQNLGNPENPRSQRQNLHIDIITNSRFPVVEVDESLVEPAQWFIPADAASCMKAETDFPHAVRFAHNGLGSYEMRIANH